MTYDDRNEIMYVSVLIKQQKALRLLIKKSFMILSSRFSVCLKLMTLVTAEPKEILHWCFKKFSWRWDIQSPLKMPLAKKIKIIIYILKLGAHFFERKEMKVFKMFLFINFPFTCGSTSGL